MAACDSMCDKPIQHRRAYENSLMMNKLMGNEDEVLVHPAFSKRELGSSFFAY